MNPKYMLLIWTLFFFLWIPSTIEASKLQPNLVINDKLLEFEAVIEEGRSYLPVRQFANSIEAQIHYHAETRAITLVNGTSWISISLTDQIVTMENGNKEEMMLLNKDNQVFVPIRFLSEYFNYQISVMDEPFVIRLYNQSQILSNEEILAKYENEFAKKPEPNVENVEKPLYLTFDDGPNQYTNQLLDILKSYNVKATFFLIEGKVRKDPNTVIRMVQEGHTIGLHSVTHNKKIVYKNPQSLLNEMEQTRKTILDVVGVNSHLVRVPYGSKPYMKQSFRDILAEYQYKMWDWSIDSLDWKLASSEIVNTVKYQLVKQEKYNQTPVILFHDTENTVLALPELIEYFIEKGYQVEKYDSTSHFVMNFWKDARL